MSGRHICSQQIDWFAVHVFVAPMLDQAGDFPMAGTVEWCDLPDDDPRKMAALMDAAQHWALRVSSNQEAIAEAAKAVSAAADWGRIGQQLSERRQFEAENPWAARPGRFCGA